MDRVVTRYSLKSLPKQPLKRIFITWHRYTRNKLTQPLKAAEKGLADAKKVEADAKKIEAEKKKKTAEGKKEEDGKQKQLKAEEAEKAKTQEALF